MWGQWKKNQYLLCLLSLWLLVVPFTGLHGTCALHPLQSRQRSNWHANKHDRHDLGCPALNIRVTPACTLSQLCPDWVRHVAGSENCFDSLEVEQHKRYEGNGSLRERLTLPSWTSGMFQWQLGFVCSHWCYGGSRWIISAMMYSIFVEQMKYPPACRSTGWQQLDWASTYVCFDFFVWMSSNGRGRKRSTVHWLKSLESRHKTTP